MKAKKAFKVIVNIVAGFVAFALLYLFFAFALSRIGISKEPVASPPLFAVYILMDGVHTDIVLPVKNEVTDWTNSIKFQDTTYQFLAFGWGDKNFYINTPTWAQLKFNTAFRAVFGLGTPAIHTTFYKHLEESAKCKKVMLNDSQYARLVAYIKASFKLSTDGNFIKITSNARHESDEAFYDANGRYSLFFTCNTWANKALKACGQQACLWTVFADGIAYQYREK